MTTATLSEDCKAHCEHTWQCEICGALVHGDLGAKRHHEWHKAEAKRRT